jgi:hypothetical protein
MTVLYVAHPVSPSPEELQSQRESAEVMRQMCAPPLPDPLDDDRIAVAATMVNVRLGMRWLAWLMKSFPRVTFIAPWITAIMSGADDTDPEQRERGLRDCCRVVERCDGIVLCGGRISSGMQRERERGVLCADGREKYGCGCSEGSRGFDVYDLTDLGPSTPLTLGVLRATYAGDHPALMALAGLG